MRKLFYLTKSTETKFAVVLTQSHPKIDSSMQMHGGKPLKRTNIHQMPVPMHPKSYQPDVQPSQPTAIPSATLGRPKSPTNPASCTPSKSSNPLNPSSTTHFCPPALCNTSQLQPTTRRPGGLLPSSSMAAQTCWSVDRMTRWSGQEARSTTAQGVCSGHGSLGLGSGADDLGSEWVSRLERGFVRESTSGTRR